MKADKKTLILLGTATALTLAASGAYAFLFFSMKSKTEATSTLSEKIQELSGKESRLTSSVLALRRESASIEKLSAYFFKESEIVNFPKKIEALGAQSGTMLTIESLDEGFTEKTAPFLNFRLRATGKFSDIMRLLVLLENFPGKFEWKTVSLLHDAPPAGQTGPSTSRSVEPAADWRVEAFLVAHNLIN